ncbi:hypothetical protein DH2020_005045 [Rehmannia glutinosa]|uniref:Glycosyltransferase n=1 Tax=Rehmannia glutinosa TaxID=99300 RepID=A0ABR0XRA9_REHGL
MDCHILLVTFPAQGHINPSLQFAKRLINIGAQVTFSTSLSAIRRMMNNPTPPITNGLNLVPFSDGYDDGWNMSDGIQNFVSAFRHRGSEAVASLISDKASQGHPFAHVVYTTFVPWVGHVARDLQVPSTLLWIQPATTFDIYYYYFTGYEEIFKKGGDDDAIELPGLSLLSRHDIPTYILSSSTTFDFALPHYKEHVEILENEITKRPLVLVNTFDAFESKPLIAINKVNMLGIGPLIPSAFLDGKDPSDTSFGGDLIQSNKGYYADWLNMKEDSSVIYVAFGSYSELSKRQMEEIGKGLLKSKRPFLWVIRATKSGEEMLFSSKEELEKQGMIVPWCSQVEVLSHKAVGCFVTHCGWNSSMEGLASGVPMVLFPLWSDQGTNAKLMEEDGKIGVRVAANGDGIVEGDEIVRCLENVMGEGEKGVELRSKAKEWKNLAKEAVMEGGSSDVNLRVFLDHVVGGNH